MYGLRAWWIILLLPAVAVAGEVPYSAVVLDLSGQATATRLGKSRPLELGALLYPQEEVETAPGASLTIGYPESGEEEQWPGGLKFSVGKIRSDNIPPQVKRRKGGVVLPDLPQEPGRGGIKQRKISNISGNLIQEVADAWLNSVVDHPAVAADGRRRGSAL